MRLFRRRRRTVALPYVGVGVKRMAALSSAVPPGMAAVPDAPIRCHGPVARCSCTGPVSLVEQISGSPWYCPACGGLV